jgi:hypothetical protein
MGFSLSSYLELEGLGFLCCKSYLTIRLAEAEQEGHFFWEICGIYILSLLEGVAFSCSRSMVSLPLTVFQLWS